MRYIIVPSAKCAPKDLSRFYDIPMVLYPINNEPIINYIVRQYNKQDIIYISSYEEHEKINAYVSRIDNCYAFKIDTIKDLGYSVFYALDKLQFDHDTKIVINFADTIVDNNDLTDNAIVYQKPTCINKKWTYVKEENGVIISIHDKDFADTNIGDYKLVCGVISIAKPSLFKDILAKNISEKGCNFYKSLQEYSRMVPFRFVHECNWLDLGHPDDYFRSKLSVKSRSFNHIEFDKNRGILKKTSDNVEKLISEIKWYVNLPNELKYVTPRIFDYSSSLDNTFLTMEFYSYPTLLELFIYGNLDETKWSTILERVKFVLDDFKRFSIKSDNIRKSLFDMYYLKTIDRLNELEKKKDFSAFFRDNIFVNGIKYISLDAIIGRLKNIVVENLMTINNFVVIHGDLCFANILIDEKLNFLKLIDPRGQFGSYDIYGDQRYELAKLFHSIDGKYDLIVSNLFKLKIDGTSIDYSFDECCFDVYPLAKDVLRDLIGDRIKEIEIIEALLFLSMIPLHNENKSHQVMMIARGIEILDRWINIKES